MRISRVIGAYRTPAGRPADLVSAAVIVIATAAVLPFVTTQAPVDAEYVVPGIFFTAACAELATFTTLHALYRREPLLSTAVLVGGFLFAGLLAFGLTFTTPVGPGIAPIAPQWGEASAWIYLAWHTGVSLATLAYAVIRIAQQRAQRPLVGNQGLCYAVILGSACLAVAVFAACVQLEPRLPVLASGNDLHGYWTTGVAPAAIVFHAAALLLLGWAWARGAIPRGALLGYAAVVLEFVLRIAAGERFTVGWYAAHLIFLAASTFVLAATIRTLLGWRDRAKDLERDLQGGARQAELHAKRLGSLSRLVSSTGSDHEHLNALLAEGARNLQPAAAGFHGTIVRVDGEVVVVVASYASAAEGADSVPRPGTRFETSRTLYRDIIQHRRTMSWRDVQLEIRATSRRDESAPWAAVAGTPFLVDGAQYALGFASFTPLPQPFEPLDHAYIETLASLCALRLQEMEQRDRLRRLIEYDELTGTLNRSTFRDRVSKALADGAEGALIAIDVDRFREVNEALGYHVGDLLLGEIASALCRRTAPRDAVGRLGDDRFVIFSYESSRERVERLAVSHLHAFDAPFVIDGRAEGIPLTASVGVALTPADGRDFEQLVVRAEAAVFTAKDAGGSRLAFFDGRVEERFVSFRRTKSELTEALLRRQFMLYFQPHVELSTGRVAGVEALLRWIHPERGIVPPNAFLPFAEEHGLMGAIGAWVFDEAMRRSRRWRRTHPGMQVWFNLSAVELADPALVERLQAFGDLSGLGVEITETVAMNDIASTTKTLSAMREAGLRIALDDFGTGYSSLAHLKRLPIDVVKVDRAFIDGVPYDVHDVAIVEAVLGLASCYGFETVAEGVESDSQVAWLTYVGCTYAQGFAYARPMPAEDLEVWLADRNAPAEHQTAV